MRISYTIENLVTQIALGLWDLGEIYSKPDKEHPFIKIVIYCVLLH